MLRLLILVFALTSSPVMAAEEDMSIAAREDMRFEETKALAEQGDAPAQYDLGLMYEINKGNYAEAVKWFSLAAEQGNLDAQYRIGSMYNFGIGVPSNYAKAVKWYALAAQQGNAEAQYYLGVKYNNGGGVPENDAEAVKWFRLAAEQGYIIAQSALGIMYENGDGATENAVMAYVWYSIAAAQADGSARIYRDSVKDKLTPDQLARGQEIATRCFESGYKDCD